MKANIITAFCLVAALTGCGPREYVVYTEAMVPSVANGEALISLQKKPRIADLMRYDLVVIEQPTEERYTSLMRVIALPGERVRILDAGVSVNGRVLDLQGDIGVSYRQDEKLAIRVYGMDQDYSVPRGKVFVLGDNFPLAVDSRIYGPVPEELLIAKVKKKPNRVAGSD